MSESEQQYTISEDEKLWGFIAWLIPLIGAILVLVLKPGYKYAKYWAYLSISFFIIIIIAQVVAFAFSLIPFVGWFISTLIDIGLLIIWILGVLKSLGKTWWKPPIIYNIAKILSTS